MIKINQLKKDNKGSTLIIVVICIAFLVVLGTLLLSLTISNLQMKNIEQKSKANFYQAETALDEIKAGLVKEMANALEIAYKNVLEQFITDDFTNLSIEEKEKIFAHDFITSLSSAIMEDIGTYDIDILRQYISNQKVVIETSSGENLMVIGENYKSLTLKNIKINYRDEEEYRTTIATDMVIETPTMSFEPSSKSLLSFTDFSLIADNGIKLDAAVNVEAKGNIYAGEKGIYLSNASSFEVKNTSKVITRGDISVGERSKLHILGRGKVWANNMETLKGVDTGLSTEIHIESNCFIADDLTLNAINSNVKISGEYYGFSYNTGDIESNPNLKPTLSSSIIINGRNTTLDLSQANFLYLAGRAYLDPNTEGNIWKDSLENPRKQENIETGESLAVKGNQIAYLVPKEYIWSNTNPVSEDVYDNRPSKEVDFSKPGISGLNINDYADGYTKIFYQATGANKLVYYYLDFKSDEKANEYMQKYYEINNQNLSFSGVIDNRIGNFATSIKVNDRIQSIMSVANIFTYDSDTSRSSLLANTVKTDNINASYMAMLHVKENLKKQYDSVKTTLSENNNSTAYDPTSVFNTFVNKEKILEDSWIDTEVKVGKTIVVGDYTLIIVDNEGRESYHVKRNDDLPNGGLKGIIIATGNVHIGEDYKGLILSGDTITMSSGVRIQASTDIVEEILKMDYQHINKYFRNLPKSITDEKSALNISRIQVSDLIYYDNWVKNEE